MREMQRYRHKGAALIVVLFIVMTVTVLSLGFLSRSDVELACGENMVLRTQMDYLAESGLEHARGLILNPQEVGSEYWTGAVRQQLSAGTSDYYDVAVTKSGECNYQITCDAYRENSGVKTGRSSLTAELRLDPVIAFWVGGNTTVPPGMTVNGDVRCNGALFNSGVIGGDVFASSLTGSIAGQYEPLSELSLTWPHITAADFVSRYTVQSIGPVLSSTSLGPYNPVRVCHRTGDLQLTGNVTVEAMLLVEGDLTIEGTGNIITAAKNLPALLVTGDLIIENGGGVNVEGLAIVEGETQISAGAGDVSIVGGLFVGNGVVETAADSSGSNNVGVLYNGPTWRPSGGQENGALEFDGVNDYVQTSDNSDKLRLTSDYTLAVWIKTDATQHNWASIFSKCNASGSTNHWTLQFDNVNPRKLIVHHPIGSWDTGIRLGDVAGAWHHIRIVRSGVWMTSYLDGTERHSNTWDENPGSGEGHLNIGADRAASSSYAYKGLIDDVRIYDRAPDANETYPSVDPVGHWKLDEQGANVNVTAAPNKTAVVVWSGSGDREHWNSAAGAFFRSIERP
jgi:hypothetical protein